MNKSVGEMDLYLGWLDSTVKTIVIYLQIHCLRPIFVHSDSQISKSEKYMSRCAPRNLRGVLR
jgi:hypothetical protein